MTCDDNKELVASNESLARIIAARTPKQASLVHYTQASWGRNNCVKIRSVLKIS